MMQKMCVKNANEKIFYTGLCVIAMKYNGVLGKDIRKRRIIRKLMLYEQNKFRYTKGMSKNFTATYSYSGEYVVAACKADSVVGIDIENEKKVNQYSEVLKFFFSMDNSKIFNMIPPTVLWNLHEAIGKLELTGLMVPFYIEDLKYEGLIDNATFIHYYTSKRIVDVMEFTVYYRKADEEEVRNVRALVGKIEQFYMTVVFRKVR